MRLTNMNTSAKSILLHSINTNVKFNCSSEFLMFLIDLAPSRE